MQKDLRPRTERWDNEKTRYLGTAKDRGTSWYLYDCTHFQERSIERILGVERSIDILATYIEDVIFANLKVKAYLMENAARPMDYHGEIKRQRIQIIDYVNKISFLVEIYPENKEIFAITALLPNEEERIVRKRGNIVIEISDRIFDDAEDCVWSDVTLFDWERITRRMIPVCKTKVDASCMYYPEELYR